MQNKVQAIDPQTIQSLMNLVETPGAARMFMEKLRHTFEEVGLSTIDDLKKAWHEQNFAKLGRLGHRLKGTSRTVGAFELARICEVIEWEAKQSDPKGLSPLVTAVEDAFISAKKELANLAI